MPTRPAPIKREQALRILAQTGISPSNYAPPLFRLLWRLGSNVPPPHLLPFWQATLVLGALFGPAWTALIFVFNHMLALPVPGILALLALALLMGCLFGLSMAAYYAYGRRKHHLPTWDSLCGQDESK
ncbi:DUF6404 family protein [Chromobacterium amazonense]|uniref:DUF6404 family protein n=1 Tax=Chromobacterium amazonense TaxID=1382803 RepID=UPI003F79C2B1